jgi:predicted ABC-type ATPase
MRRLDLVIGPNGAGKSTFVARALALQLPGSVFVNADLIAKERWPSDPAVHSYEAARIASATRDALISSGRSFIAETVFSHPSKLDLLTSARKSGYTIGVHVLLIPEAMAVERVRARVAAGGHDVPEDKIRERYRRLWSLVAVAMARADKATAYDNSRRKGPQIVAELSGGFIVGATAWPEWTPEALRAIS